MTVLPTSDDRFADHDTDSSGGPTSVGAVHASMNLDIQHRGVTAAFPSRGRC